MKSVRGEGNCGEVGVVRGVPGDRAYLNSYCYHGVRLGGSDRQLKIAADYSTRRQVEGRIPFCRRLSKLQLHNRASQNHPSGVHSDLLS